MLYAFFESIKYVGHLIPVAFLRIFIGYYYINQVASQYVKYLSHPYLSEHIVDFLPRSGAPDIYKGLLETLVIPNYQLFSYALLGAQLAIGASYLLGYLVRPASLLGVFLTVNLIWALGPTQGELQNVFLLVIHITLGWLGAGRCLGLDYFFYKRRRGIWW